MYHYKYHCKNDNYYIILDINKYTDLLIDDGDIACFLGISEEEYQKILKQFNGNMIECNGYTIGIYFKYRKDCENAIKYLYEITDSCLIAKELIGE